MNLKHIFATLALLTVFSIGCGKKSPEIKFARACLDVHPRMVNQGDTVYIHNCSEGDRFYFKLFHGAIPGVFGMGKQDEITRDTLIKWVATELGVTYVVLEAVIDDGYHGMCNDTIIVK